MFTHSPVYRIGGDEFVVILRKNDLANADRLLLSFEKSIDRQLSKENAHPWESPSVAVGTAFYDKNTDFSVEDVFRRADDAMYKKKKEMKAERQG